MESSCSLERFTCFFIDPRSRYPRLELRSSFRDSLDEKSLELLKFGGGCLGDGTEFQFAFTPINPLIALQGPCVRRGPLFPGWPDEDTNGMLGTRIDEHGDRATVHNVNASTQQCESILGD